MNVRSDSAVGVRFLASMQEGRVSTIGSCSWRGQGDGVRERQVRSSSEPLLT